MGPLTATTHEWYAATTSPVALPVKPWPVAHQAQPTVWKQLSHDAARHTGQPDVYQSLNGQLTAPLERDPTGLHVLVVAHHPGHNATRATVSDVGLGARVPTTVARTTSTGRGALSAGGCSAGLQCGRRRINTSGAAAVHLPRRRELLAPRSWQRWWHITGQAGCALDSVRQEHERHYSMKHGY